MIAAAFLAHTLSVAAPVQEHFVRLDEHRWATAEDARHAKPAAPDLWWHWSDQCAPAIANADVTELPCAATRHVVVSTTSARRPLPNGELVWGTRALIEDVPEELLPHAATDQNGTVTLAVPADGAVYVRLVGPAAVTDWRPVEPRSERVELAGVASTDIVIDAVDERRAAAAYVRALVSPADATNSDQPSVFLQAAKGTLRFRRAAAGVSRVTIWSETNAPAERVDDNRSLSGTVTLPAGCGLRGSLITADAHPVAGGTVAVLFPAGTSGRAARRHVMSGGDGRFVMNGVACGVSMFMVVKKPFASIRRELKTNDGTLDLKRIVLEPGVSVRVKVVDERNGRAIAGARLRVREAPLHATSDRDGVALLDSVGGEEIDVDTAADGYLPATVRIATSAAKPQTIRLSPAAVVLATVTRGDTKQPAGPGSATIDFSGKKWIEQFGSDGRIQLQSLPSGTLKLEVRVPGLASRRLPQREIIAGQKTDYGTIALETGSMISGSVVDAATSAPLQARVRVPRPNAIGLRFSVVRNDWIETSTDDEGHFELSGLDAGDYRLLVDAPGYGPLLTDRLSATREAAENTAGIIHLAPARRLTITCHPSKRCGSKAQLLLGDPSDDWAAVSAGVTNGKSEIVRTPVGRHQLQLLDRGAILAEKEVVVRDDARETAVDIALREVEVSGEVVRGGRPVTGGALQFAGRRSANAGVPIFIDHKLDSAVVSSDVVGAMAPSGTVAVDDRGAFTTRDIAPGTYSVTYSGAAGSSPEREVTIPDADSFQLRIDMPATTLTGRVVDEQGKTPEWARVEVHNATGVMSADIEPDGRFAIDGATAGTAKIHAYNDDSEVEREVIIASDRETEVDLVLRHKAPRQLTLTATDASGAVRAGAKLFLSCDGGIMSADADSNGSASFALRSASGSCIAAALSAGDGWAFAGPFPATGDDSTPVPVRFSGRASTLVIESKTASAFGIAAANGFALERTFPFIGWSSMTRPDQPARLRGLPPGTYAVRLATGSVRNVIVDGTRDVTIGFLGN